MCEDIILVNEQDEWIGYGEKLPVHEKKQLHRAFSIFIVDLENGRMLLQRRAFGKYHSGGLWTNACCSHPRRGEAMDACLSSRMKEELGLDVTLRIVDAAECGMLTAADDVVCYCGKFRYFADYGSLAEHEIDNVFLYCPKTAECVPMDQFDPEEIAELKWVSLGELKRWMEEKPEEFTFWFPLALEVIRDGTFGSYVCH